MALDFDDSTLFSFWTFTEGHGDFRGRESFCAWTLCSV